MPYDQTAREQFPSHRAPRRPVPVSRTDPTVTAAEPFTDFLGALDEPSGAYPQEDTLPAGSDLPPRGQGMRSQRIAGGTMYGAERPGVLPVIDETDPRGAMTAIRPNVRPPGHPAPAANPYTSNRPDVVLPRVYIEPDEAMDDLRRTRDRWAIARDVWMVLFLMPATSYVVMLILAGFRH